MKKKITTPLYCYLVGALLLPVVFYLLGHALDSVFRFWFAVPRPTEHSYDAIADTAVTLFGWAIGDYLLTRKQNKRQSETDQPVG